MVPPLIALEEHFFSAAAEDSTVKEKYIEQFKYVPGVEDKLKDLEHLRFDEMAKGQISMQIISHCPGTLTADQAVAANDQLAEAVKKHPDRFAGFAVLSMAHPQYCADELERCVKQLGFVGALVDNHVNGAYFDGDEYDVFWRKAEALSVPIYLHPTWPSDSMAVTGNFTAGAGRSLGSSGWGWHSDVGQHVLRLHAANVFEKFPRLKIIIGHFGEMLPFMLQRICVLSNRWGERKRHFKQVWDENIWITTSGVWSLDPLRCMLAEGNTRVGRILFSVDFPFEKNENGLKWIRELEESGLVSREQLEMIAFRNAEELFGVKAPKRDE